MKKYANVTIRHTEEDYERERVEKRWKKYWEKCRVTVNKWRDIKALLLLSVKAEKLEEVQKAVAEFDQRMNALA